MWTSQLWKMRIYCIFQENVWDTSWIVGVGANRGILYRSYYYLPGGPSILNKDVHIALILLPLLILLRCVLSTYYHDTLTLIGNFLFGSIIGVRKSRVRSRLSASSRSGKDYRVRPWLYPSWAVVSRLGWRWRTVNASMVYRWSRLFLPVNVCCKHSLLWWFFHVLLRCL